jgi:phosphoadenosine phosphosulfate reductase
VTTLTRTLAALGEDDPGVPELIEHAAAANGWLEHARGADVLAWAAETIPRFAVTSSFGADSAVLLHLVATVTPHVPVLFLETGLHFDETIAFRRSLAARLGLEVVDVRPERTVLEQARDHGHELWARDPDRCCGLRKTAPLRGAIAAFDGWASGVRRDQTPNRARTPIVEARRHDGRFVLKVAPLARWAGDDIARYLAFNDLPRHPLVDDGYGSIGCAPCTTRSAPGGDPRAGRWAAFDDKTECGIHLDGDDPTTTAG